MTCFMFGCGGGVYDISINVTDKPVGMRACHKHTCCHTYIFSHFGHCTATCCADIGSASLRNVCACSCHFLSERSETFWALHLVSVVVSAGGVCTSLSVGITVLCPSCISLPLHTMNFQGCASSLFPYISHPLTISMGLF